MTCNALSFGCPATDCEHCADNEAPAGLTVGDVVRMQNRIDALEREAETLKRIIMQGIGQHGQPGDNWTAEAATALAKG